MPFLTFALLPRVGSHCVDVSPQETPADYNILELNLGNACPAAWRNPVFKRALSCSLVRLAISFDHPRGYPTLTRFLIGEM
eukprot:5783348-Pyramimonas_sp.AAC.1